MDWQFYWKIERTKRRLSWKQLDSLLEDYIRDHWPKGKKKWEGLDRYRSEWDNYYTAQNGQASRRSSIATVEAGDEQAARVIEYRESEVNRLWKNWVESFDNSEAQFNRRSNFPYGLDCEWLQLNPN